eukprot:TRINITY_DN2996_c0_g2_i1.p1 TRINITY_DN2996_c0_g2~~TRINITY_DN2996_c0_g2_i1.p1  ORF type:complete len:197 (-),score=7.84 TRINITY_DN2996_c0_g2_i1:48-638(-)
MCYAAPSDKQTVALDHHEFDVFLFGDQGVGKRTLLAQSLTEDEHKRKVPHKIPAGDTYACVNFNRHNENPNVQPDVYHVFHAVGAVLMYDVTRRSTFDYLSKCIGKVKPWFGRSYVVVVLANKTDMPEEKREVSKEEGEKLAAEHNFMYIEVSLLKDDLLKVVSPVVQVLLDRASNHLLRQDTTKKTYEYESCNIL